MLTLNTRVRYADLPDGLHNSILLGEALEVRWGEGVFGSLRSITETWGPPGISTTHPRSTQARLKVVRKQIQRQKAKLEQAALEKAAQMQSDSRPALPGQETPRGADEPSPGEDTPAEEDLPESDSSEVRNAESGLITFSGVIHSDIDEIPNSMAAASDRPPSPPHPIQLPPSQAFGFWPTHLDGGHFLMVDGSVRLISRHVETEVLRRLANRLDTQDPGAF